MDVEQRYSLMYSDLEHQEHEWTITPTGLPSKCCTLQLATTTSPTAGSSLAESETDGVWQLLGDMDLPRSMLLAGRMTTLGTPQGGDAAGAKRKLPFDDDFLTTNGPLMLIGSEAYYSEQGSSSPERGEAADSSLGLFEGEGQLPITVAFASGDLQSNRPAPSEGKAEPRRSGSSLEDIKRRLCASDGQFMHWNRRSLQQGGVTKMRRAATECTNEMLLAANSGIMTPAAEIIGLIHSNVGVEHVIPCHDSPRDAIKRVTPTTVTQILAGQFSDRFSRILIVDCRYPYEYHGGHVPSAINVCSLDEIDRHLFGAMADLTLASSTVIIFHCEFSSERAPRMALHVRNRDRELHAESYPALHYPQLYILEGGYKNFFLQYPEHCEPPHQYVPMRKSDHRDELRHHQRLKFTDGQSHGKHRHKLRSCSLRKAHSIAMPHPVAAISSYYSQRTNEASSVRLNSTSLVTAVAADMLSSDIGDICDQADSILHAAESFLLSTMDDGRASK